MFAIVIHIRFSPKLQKGSSVQESSFEFVRELNHAAFVRELSVQLWSANQRTTEAEEVTDW
jgi:hypothetical protein